MNYKKYIFISCIVLVLNALNSQLLSAQNNEDKAKKYFEQKNYTEALKLYLDISKNTNTPEISYQIACCYLELTIDKTRAIPYIERAMQTKEFSENPEVIYNAALAYSYGYQFEKSIAYLNQCISLFTSPDLIKKAEHQLEMVLNAQALVQSPTDVKFINLGKKINSRFSETNPFINEMETILFYNSDREGNSDIFFSTKKENSADWVKSKAAEFGLNSYQNEKVTGYTKDGLYLFFTDSVKNMQIAQMNQTEYYEIKEAGENINTFAIEEGASFSSTKDTLFFSSDIPGGIGGYDIYYSVKLPTGEWGKPINMGEPINTIYDENYPQLSTDGLTFTFCSSGHNSMGGYDIFTCTKNVIDEKWNSPINYGYPINDVYDNFTISLSGNKRYGYISSNRPGGIGETDVYKLVFNGVEAENMIYHGTVSVIDTTTGSAKSLKNYDIAISITVYNKADNSIYGIYAINKNTGSYVISLTPGTYDLVIEGKKYITYRKEMIVEEGTPQVNKKNMNIFLQLK